MMIGYDIYDCFTMEHFRLRQRMTLTTKIYCWPLYLDDENERKREREYIRSIENNKKPSLVFISQLSVRITSFDRRYWKKLTTVRESRFSFVNCEINFLWKNMKHKNKMTYIRIVYFYFLLLLLLANLKTVKENTSTD
jgi:hypothetical protein